MDLGCDTGSFDPAILRRGDPIDLEVIGTRETRLCRATQPAPFVMPAFRVVIANHSMETF